MGSEDREQSNGGSKDTSSAARAQRVRDTIVDQGQDQGRGVGGRHGPHDVPPWPGDPGLGSPSLELPDPDGVRTGAIDLGETMQGTSKADLEEHGGFFDGFYKLVATIRTNAVVAHTARLIAPLRQTGDTTKTREAIEVADGKRAADQARRLEAETPRLEADAKAANDALGLAKGDVERAEAALEERRDEAVDVREQHVASNPDREPKPTIAEKIGLSGPKLLVLMISEVLAALLQLDSALSKVVAATFPLETDLIALTMAAGLQLSAFAAGRLLAAIELPQRAVPLLFLAAFGYVLAELVPELNLLREGSPKGETALTWVSLMIAIVAAATGWASALRQDFEMRLVAYWEKPERLTLRWNEKIAFQHRKITDAKATVSKCESQLAEAEESLSEHRSTISALFGVVDGTGMRGLKERLVGEEARANIATEITIEKSMVDSEKALGGWATNIARHAWFRKRAEKLAGAEVSTGVVPMTARSGEPRKRMLTPALVAAILSLSAGSLGAAIAHSLIVLAFGTGLAAVLFALSLWASRTTSPGSRPGTTAPNAKAALHPLGEDSPGQRWKELPSYLVPKYSGTNGSNSNDVS